jgi:hypothetical protein
MMTSELKLTTPTARECKNLRNKIPNRAFLTFASWMGLFQSQDLGFDGGLDALQTRDILDVLLFVGKNLRSTVFSKSKHFRVLNCTSFQLDFASLDRLSHTHASRRVNNKHDSEFVFTGMLELGTAQKIVHRLRFWSLFLLQGKIVDSSAKLALPRLALHFRHTGKHCSTRATQHFAGRNDGSRHKRRQIKSQHVGCIVFDAFAANRSASTSRRSFQLSTNSTKLFLVHLFVLSSDKNLLCCELHFLPSRKQRTDFSEKKKKKKKEKKKKS